MNANKGLRKALSLLLALVMIVGLLPVNAMAAEPIVLIGGGDYQQAGDHANSSDNVANILDQVVAAGFDSADGFLFIGDYDCETHDDSSETAAGITSLMGTMNDYYPNLDEDNSVLVQGNHDTMDSRIDATGGHDFDGYSAFVMNEDDYPNYGGSESQAKALAEELDAFLAEKLEAGYTAPIFVTSHVPLHFGPRTNRQGDGKYAIHIFEVLNAYGAEGLNIIFMHGHNHAYGYDEYMGGEAIYLPVGDKINIAQNGSQSSYDTYTLNFTYMNAGYTGYYNESGYSTSSGTEFLTMTTFRIYEDRVEINRFSEDGLYNMKSAGQKKGDYISSVSVSANTSVYASAQTVILNTPAERITLEDAATGITVTGILTEGSFDDASDLTVAANQEVEALNDTSLYAAYEAYDMTFTASGAVSVTMPVPAAYSQKYTKVYHVEGDTLTDMNAEISLVSGELMADFTATAGGVYAVVSENANLPSVYYERVESVSDLVSGEEYLIVFDCSSQTTSDAIVMPEIATYSSGSSKRMGPDVLVSDGIADEDVITGDYDEYLWTLTASGSGWLIGNGSESINVTYSSTTSRCELDFTTSGEALTIAAASSNPSDADSYSFAVYDGSGYYWQYNTTATLIYGTNGDSYTSRFIFYKRVAEQVNVPSVSEGWIELEPSGTYELDTDGIETGEDNKYVIVGNSNDYALSLSGSTVGRTAVTVEDNTITVEDPEAVEFWFASNSKESGTYLLTQNGSDTVYHANGNMYYGSDSKGYWYVGSSSNGSYKVYDYDNMNWYLNYGYVWASESVSRFAVSSNTRYVRLFKAVDSFYGGAYGRLAGELEQSYTTNDAVTADEALSGAYIELTDDGTAITNTVTVTADMVSWDKSFDGSAVGTYTGTVTYGGRVLGTVTVEIGSGHEWETITVEATCTESGSVTTRCTICGESTVEIIEALGHDYQCVVTEATCGADGSAVSTCTGCGDTYTELLPATGEHSYQTETVDATCTGDGSVTHTCTVCGSTRTETIPATGHSYTAAITGATCEAAGYTTYTCAGCGDSYVSDETAALGHDYETVTVEATCTAGGYTADTCTRCGEGTVYNETAALGHAYSAVTVEATCETAGQTTHTCGNCGDSYVSDETAALGHDNTSVVTEATCTTDGYTTHTCARCGKVTMDSHIAALGHAYETVTVEATCETAGSVTRTCTRCGDRSQEVLAALGHAYESVTVEATCETAGCTTYTCGNCGDSYVSDEVAALGHSYTAAVTEATCETDGYTTYTCAGCGDSYVADEVAALGHSYTAAVTEATCETAGYTTYTCAGCDGSYVADEVAALGHAYSAAVTEATCETAGYTTYTCANCGDSYVADQVAALGHSYTAAESNGYMVYTCENCGHSYSEALSHTYTRVTSISSGNAYVITLYSGRKYYALSHEGNEISVVQVTVSDGEITSEITDDLVWNYSGSKLSYEDGGATYYLYASSSGSGWWGNWFGSASLTLSTSNSSTVSLSNNKLKIGSYYLRYSSSKASLNRSSGTTTYFFIEE